MDFADEKRRPAAASGTIRDPAARVEQEFAAIEQEEMRLNSARLANGSVQASPAHQRRMNTPDGMGPPDRRQQVGGLPYHPYLPPLAGATDAEAKCCAPGGGSSSSFRSYAMAAVIVLASIGGAYFLYRRWGGKSAVPASAKAVASAVKGAAASMGAAEEEAALTEMLMRLKQSSAQ